MIQLYQFSPNADGVNISPFCSKVETYLRMADLTYVPVNANPRAAPKKKLPFIEDDGVIVADSTLIVQHLKRKYGDPFDAALTSFERALATAIQRLLEDHLYFAIRFMRFVPERGWRVLREVSFDPVPRPLRGIVAPLARAYVRFGLDQQGFGQHTPKEVEAMACADIDALVHLLDDKTYMLGAAPTSIDATAYGFLANIIYAPFPSTLSDYTRRQSNLVAYADRMRARYFAAPSAPLANESVASRTRP